MKLETANLISLADRDGDVRVESYAYNATLPAVPALRVTSLTTLFRCIAAAGYSLGYSRENAEAFLEEVQHFRIDPIGRSSYFVF